MDLKLRDGDILSICQKIVSKAEGRLVNLNDIEPSPLALKFAERWDKDPRSVELVLRQTSRIVRMDNAVLIVETGPGWVCANAGIDESNSLEDDRAILLPEDPDASAVRMRDELKRLTGAEIAVLVTDTFGRPWRDGLTEVCLGIAGHGSDARSARDHRPRRPRTASHRHRDCRRTRLRRRPPDAQGGRDSGRADSRLPIQARRRQRQGAHPSGGIGSFSLD